MLRGRCSCAISERPTRSPASQSPLTPLFPLHTRNSPVTPFFPLHTQKQGGRGSEISPVPFSADLITARSCHLRSSRLRLCALRVLRSESPLCSERFTPNCQITAENAKIACITLRLSITIINKCRRADIFGSRKNSKIHQIAIRRAMLFSNCELLTLDCFSPLTPIIPVHPRHSPVSPIIPVHTQKQGGGRASRTMSSPLTPLFSPAIVTIC